MYNNKLDFWDFVAANSGERAARWKIIRGYEKYINKVTRGEYGYEKFNHIKLIWYFWWVKWKGWKILLKKK